MAKDKKKELHKYLVFLLGWEQTKRFFSFFLSVILLLNL